MYKRVLWGLVTAVARWSWLLRRLPTFAHGALVAVAVGLTVGVLAGTTYTIAGGLTTGPGGLGWVVAALALGTAALAVSATWLMARHVRMGTLTELMQRE